MKLGKLTPDLLAHLLSRLPGGDPRVLVGPRVGEDAAVIDVGDRLLVAKTDPVTFATDLIGWYAVNVNANDIATMGAEPRWFMGSLLLPKSADEAAAAGIFDQIAAACRALGVTAVGGHTEVTIGLDRPILVGCMLGEVERDSLVTSSGARPGDVLILTGGIAVEGAALLAREVGKELMARGMAAEAVAQARDLLLSPGISVVPAARAAMAAGGVTALHDPTEGGLATGLRELGAASEVGLEVDAEAITVLPLTQQVCTLLALDPLGLIASGALLVAARPEAAEATLASVRKAGVNAAILGKVLPEAEGLWLLAAGERRPLPEFARDEIARFLDEKE
jgi:hydrogenase maturation factor